MLNIQTNKTHLALEKHWEGLKETLQERLVNKAISKKSNQALSIEQIEKIIKGKPKDLLSLHQELDAEVKTKGEVEEFEEEEKGQVKNNSYLESIFDYNDFTKKK